MPSIYAKRLQRAQRKWDKTNGPTFNRISALLTKYASMQGYPNAYHHHSGTVKKALDAWSGNPESERSADSLVLAISNALEGSKMNPKGTLATLIHTIVSEAHLQSRTVRLVQQQLKSAASMDTARAIKELKRYSANGFVRFWRGELKNDHVGLVRQVLKDFDATKDVKDLVAALNRALTEKGVTLDAKSPLAKMIGILNKVGNPKVRADEPVPTPEATTVIPSPQTTPVQSPAPSPRASQTSSPQPSQQPQPQSNSGTQASPTPPMPQWVDPTTPATEEEQLENWLKVSRAIDANGATGNQARIQEVLNQFNSRVQYHYNLKQFKYHTDISSYRATIEAYTKQMRGHLEHLHQYQASPYLQKFCDKDYFNQFVQGLYDQVNAIDTLSELQLRENWAQDPDYFKPTSEAAVNYFSITFSLNACVSNTLDALVTLQDLGKSLVGFAKQAEAVNFLNTTIKAELEKFEQMLKLGPVQLREKMLEDEKLLRPINDTMYDLHMDGLKDKLIAWSHQQGVDYKAHLVQRKQALQLRAQWQDAQDSLVRYAQRIRSYFYLMPLLDPNGDHATIITQYKATADKARALSKEAPSGGRLGEFKNLREEFVKVVSVFEQSHPDLFAYANSVVEKLRPFRLNDADKTEKTVEINFAKFKALLSKLKDNVTSPEDQDTLQALIDVKEFKELKLENIEQIAAVQGRLGADLTK